MTNPQMPGVPASGLSTDWRNDPDLSEKWKFRFNFFEENGVPSMGPPSPKMKAAFKALGFTDRLKVNMNFFAFFFSAIYFAVGLKMWRQALVALGLILAFGLIGAIFNLPDPVMRGGGVGLQMLFGLRANALYYLQRTKGDIGWKFL